jgi:hypothetical protein
MYVLRVMGAVNFALTEQSITVLLALVVWSSSTLLVRFPAQQDIQLINGMFALNV